ncbi:MAG: hypothetical protein PHI90_04775 [Clostridia bacterium]|nr:hypothetical protein [Clostridia bacterium]MDD4048127.1 hypothetical protein [Clostridia bacterium]
MKILELFVTEKQLAKKKFERCMNVNDISESICLDYEERHRIADDEMLKKNKSKTVLQ